jgi:hypothetical protein
MHITKKAQHKMLSAHKFVIRISLYNSYKDQLKYVFSLVNIAKRGNYLANNARFASKSHSCVKKLLFHFLKLSERLDDKILIF